jgi:NAD(P)H-nitrite reductase large subunit
MTFASLFDENTVCSCQNITKGQNMYDIQRSDQGKCRTSCNGQICGVSDSIYAYLNEDLPLEMNNCEVMLMFYGLKSEENITVNALNGEKQEVIKNQ